MRFDIIDEHVRLARARQERFSNLLADDIEYLKEELLESRRREILYKNQAAEAVEMYQEERDKK